jgi:hypothetical protein
MSEIKRYSVADILCLDEKIDLCKYKDVEPIIQRNKELEAEFVKFRKSSDIVIGIMMDRNLELDTLLSKAQEVLFAKIARIKEIEAEIEQLRMQNPVWWTHVDSNGLDVFVNMPFCLGEVALYAEPKPAQEIPDYVAKRMHYPECWDTSAYPTVLSALIESSQGCTDCNPSAQIPAELVKWVNNDEPNLEMDDSADVALEKIVRNECRAFVKSQLEKMKVGE